VLERDCLFRASVCVRKAALVDLSQHSDQRLPGLGPLLHLSSRTFAAYRNVTVNLGRVPLAPCDLLIVRSDEEVFLFYFLWSCNACLDSIAF